MVYFGLPDVAGHFFWRYHEPEAFAYDVPPEHVKRLGERLSEVYRVMDVWLGELLEVVPPETRVMVLSDHGMQAGRSHAEDRIQSGRHADGPDGVIILAGPGIEARGLLPASERRMGDILQVTPSLLEWLDLPLAEDMPSEPLRGSLTDASRASRPDTRVASYSPGFREATPPRAPREGLDEEFVEGLKQLGYVWED